VLNRVLNKVGLTNWRRRLIAVLVLLPLLGVGSVEVTSQSSFCNSCHIMEPYYTSWKRGAHKDIECVKCHISPGVDNFIMAKMNGLGQVVDDVLNRTSMKPSASVSALSCTRGGCHDIERVRVSKKTAGDFLFRHDKHLDLEYSGIKLACGVCHSHVSGAEHFEVNTNVCLTCHLLKRDPVQATPGSSSVIRLMVREAKPGEKPDVTEVTDPSTGARIPPAGCITCHNPPAGTIERGGLKITHADYLSYGAACESCHRGSTEAPAPVENGQCFECHTFGLERNGDVETMHRVHTSGEHKVECFSCHGAIRHGPVAQAARLDQFDCLKCHADQHGVQRRTYLHKDQDAVVAATTASGSSTVSPMFLAHVDCVGCHVSPRAVSTRPDSGATVAAATPQSCDACHQPGFGAEMVPLWQSTTHKLFDDLAAALATAEASSTLGDAARADLLEVRKLMNIVKTDGSWGVHNPSYTQQVLERAREKLTLATTRPGESSK
jgi:nitrate/TMAO reductase-like tetraheme cytochrome c subunit